MATKTAGTPATTTLTAVQYFPNISDADLATLNQKLWRDTGPLIAGSFAAGPGDGAGNKPGQTQPSGFSKDGIFTSPGGRGFLKAWPGDWFAVDGLGNGFIIPQRALPKTLTNTCTLTTGSNTVTSTTDIRTLGWQVGTALSSTHTPANAVIGSIGPDGKSYTMVTVTNSPYAVVAANATAGAGAETVTAGSFTHS